MPSDAPTIDYRQLLEDERRQLQSELSELGHGEGGGLDYDPNFADTSQVTAERGEADVLAGQLQETLDEVALALGRLEDGTYGTLRGVRRGHRPGPPRGHAGHPILHQSRQPALIGPGRMAYGGYGGGSGGAGRPRRRFQPDQRTLIIVVVAVALIAILLRTHKITSANIIYFCVLIPSIILHEISHGVVALAFGDDTAKRAGRLTLNPVKHVDPVGTLLVPAVLSLSGIGAYGWAKPVPVSTNRLRSPRNHTVLVSLVGPLTNFALAAVLGAMLVWPHRAVLRPSTSAGRSEGAYPPTLLGRSSSSPASPTSCSACSTASRARPSTGPPSSSASCRPGCCPSTTTSSRS